MPPVLIFGPLGDLGPAKYAFRKPVWIFIFYSKHHAAERWDLEFGSYTTKTFENSLKNLKTHKKTYVEKSLFPPYYFFLRDMISNIGKITQHVSCIYSEEKAITPTDSKLVAKYAFLQALSKLEIGWQAPGGILGPGLLWQIGW